METRVGAIAGDIDTRVAQFEDLLGSRIEAVAGRIESSGRQASEDLMSRAEMLSSGIKSHVEDAERSLTNLVVNTAETIQTGARTAQQALLTVSSDVGAQLKLTSAEVEAALTAVGTGAAASILTSAQGAQTSLVSASEAASQIKSRRRRRAHHLGCRRRHGRVGSARGARGADHAGDRIRGRGKPRQVASADVERALSVAGTATAEAVTAGAREAQSTLVAASTEAATQVKSLAADVQRSLSSPERRPPSRSPQAPARPRAPS